MDKSPDAFRTISEVADDLDLPQHVLRFWETRFPQIKPLKRGGGRRYYRPDDIDLLRGIRHLLYGEGYTIKGVQRILKEESVRFVQSVGRGDERVPAPPASADDGSDDENEDTEIAVLAQPAMPNGDRSRGRSGALATAAGKEPHRTAGDESGPSLERRDIERLKAALDDLVECKRVLSTLAALDEPGGPDEALD